MEILDKLDFLQILSIGISGFGFLLILLAFILIYKEQSRDGEPRKGILSTIRFFMGLNFVSVLVVGAFSLPVINKNGQLQGKLEDKNRDFEVYESTSRLNNLIDSSNPSELNDQQLAAADNYVESLDSIAAEYEDSGMEGGSEKADSVNVAKTIIAQHLIALKSDTASAKTRKSALEGINRVNSRLLKYIKDKSKSGNK